ncbi:phage head-tail adapter protein [Parabacteroides distasonis]|uniref:phage head-tail adapter protein n=1 Tax=Parabacteroides distasonis TaxID=823 RepID=UPI001BA63596|nr:phage head-tail adapter protein [Parabacteroides distasonis]QUR49899.1 phage head-tail adapter protein [Parabacteroides distasonis]
MGNELVKLCTKIKDEISNENTFHSGIKDLLLLRKQLFDILLQFKTELCRDDFNAMPFIGEDGFHSKTIAYSIWHIFRIEDIVSHTLISGDDQIFFVGNFQERIGSPILTTGNELIEHQIADFSKSLDLDELYKYALSVKIITDWIIENMTFADMSRKIQNSDRMRLESLNVVSQSDNAHWLIDYWCGEDLRGLILMPFSEHWMAHIYACMLIRDKIYSK